MKIRKQGRFSKIQTLAASRGSLFEHYPNAYEFDVVSCLDAARARRVPISAELKHLLVDISERFVMVHLPGDRRLCLRKVKNLLSTKTAHLSDVRKFPDLQPGTVCPFVAPFWEGVHLVDRSILRNGVMTTNDATLRGYLRFDPKLILLARRVVVCEIKSNADG